MMTPVAKTEWVSAMAGRPLCTSTGGDTTLTHIGGSSCKEWCSSYFSGVVVSAWWWMARRKGVEGVDGLEGWKGKRKSVCKDRWLARVQ